MPSRESFASVLSLTPARVATESYRDGSRTTRKRGMSGDEVGKADHAGSGVRPKNSSNLGELDVDARIARGHPLAQLLGIRLGSAVHDGELAHLAVPFEQLDQPAERLRPSARPPEWDHLAVFQLQDRLDVQQGPKQRTRLPDTAAALEI